MGDTSTALSFANMIELGQASENEMVAAFLQAEVDSPRFGLPYAYVFQRLQASGLTRQVLLENPDLLSARDNAARAQMLQEVRGYRADCYLFAGFPRDVTWRRVGIEPTDWAVFTYANDPAWVKLSGGTRRLIDGANNIDSIIAGNANENIKSLVTRIKQGKKYPPLIAVEDGHGRIVLAEGHCRATAYAIVKPTDAIECLVGTSSGIRTWRYY